MESLRLALVAVMLAGTAHAQSPSLVGGVWIHSDSFDDVMHPGNTILVSTLAMFRSNGTLTVERRQSSAGIAFASTSEYRYQLTGPSTYATILIDWGPKLNCSSGIACTQYPNPFGPIGTRSQCRFEFESALAVNLGCEQDSLMHWTRHDG